MTTVAVHAGSFDALPVDEPFPGIRRRSFSTTYATVTSYVFRPDAGFPRHSHPQEQITLVEEGEAMMTVEGVTRRLLPGEWSVVPPGVEHGFRAGDVGARIVVVIVPRRERPDEYTLTGRDA